jgi:hypothetical protein
VPAQVLAGGARAARWSPLTPARGAQNEGADPATKEHRTGRERCCGALARKHRMGVIRVIRDHFALRARITPDHTGDRLGNSGTKGGDDHPNIKCSRALRDRRRRSLSVEDDPGGRASDTSRSRAPRRGPRAARYAPFCTRRLCPLASNTRARSVRPEAHGGRASGAGGARSGALAASGDWLTGAVVPDLCVDALRRRTGWSVARCVRALVAGASVRGWQPDAVEVGASGPVGAADSLAVLLTQRGQVLPCRPRPEGVGLGWAGSRTLTRSGRGVRRGAWLFAGQVVGWQAGGMGVICGVLLGLLVVRSWRDWLAFGDAERQVRVRDGSGE